MFPYVLFECGLALVGVDSGSLPAYQALSALGVYLLGLVMDMLRDLGQTQTRHPDYMGLWEGESGGGWGGSMGMWTVKRRGWECGKGTRLGQGSGTALVSAWGWDGVVGWL